MPKSNYTRELKDLACKHRKYATKGEATNHAEILSNKRIL